MRLLRWLRSRPLARVRRNLAIERRIRERLQEEYPSWMREAASPENFRAAWHRLVEGWDEGEKP